MVNVIFLGIMVWREISLPGPFISISKTRSSRSR